MKGIQFVVDSSGKKTAVVIDLSEHGEAWEDFYDCLTTQQQADEPTYSVDEVREELGLSES